jgi:hypothetical protein
MPGTTAAHNHPDAADPLADAMAPPEPGRVWGQVRDITIRSIGFPKNADGSWGRPEPYNPDLHEFESKQIKFILAPLDPTRKFVEIEIGLDNRKNPEFRQIVQPSILALGTKICQLRGIEVENANFFRELIGLYVFCEYVPRPWNKQGETWTTIEFRDVFLTEAECQAHQAAMQGGEGDELDEQMPMPEEESETPADPQRVAMAAFLPPLWAQAKGSIDEFHKLIASNAMLSPLFDNDSPEVLAVIDTTPF